MAIVVGSTEVIDDDFKLQNITGANGKYDAFHANVNAITNVIDMNKPIMTLNMSGNVTFTESNKSAGKTAVLILDTSSSAHTPTFSANVKWGSDTEPTWGDYRYWNIAFVCWDSSIVRAVAVGYNA